MLDSRPDPVIPSRSRLHQSRHAICHQGIGNQNAPVIFYQDRAPTVDEQRAFISRMIELPRSILLVAEADQHIVGMLDFHGHQKPQRSHAGEFGMSVAKDWRGNNIGFRLIDHLLEWAKWQQIRRVELEVFSNNSAAISLYEKAGFIREGRKVNAVEVDGAYIDLIMASASVR